MAYELNERVLEVSPPSRLTLGEGFSNLPRVCDYYLVAPEIFPPNLESITHINQIVIPLSQARCREVASELDFDHFLVSTLTDMARGVDVQEPNGAILARVVLLLTMYQYRGSYGMGQHVENILGLAANAKVLHLEETLFAQPYAYTTVMRAAEDGEKCPICWESFKPVENTGPENDDSDLDFDAPEDETMMATTRCNHEMCLDCLERWIQDSETCPLCRAFL